MIRISPSAHALGLYCPSRRGRPDLGRFWEDVVKKSVKKLVISKETLRHLEEVRLKGAAAAAADKTYMSCIGTCGFESCNQGSC
jgi:hypothetical protein